MYTNEARPIHVYVELSHIPALFSIINFQLLATSNTEHIRIVLKWVMFALNRAVGWQKYQRAYCAAPSVFA